MRHTMGCVAAGLLAVTSMAYGDHNQIPSGTSIDIRTNESINVKEAGDGRIFSAVVDKDVLYTDGRVGIPKGSNAALAVRKISSSEMALDLDSITVGGQRYVVQTDSSTTQSADERDGLGKNKRTGKYVGGGALLGTIIGAVGGGGKGAAIGAAAGAAAGAGVQVLTRGKSVKVPSESVLTFRTNSPLEVTTAPASGTSAHQQRLRRNRNR